MDETRSGMGVAQILRIVILLAFLALVGWLIYAIRHTLLPFGVAFVLSYVLMPLVDRMESRGISRMAGVLVIYVFTVASLALLLVLFVPILLNGLDNMKVRLVGDKAERLCLLVNRANAPFALERVECNQADFSTVFPPLPLELPAGSQDVFKVEFSPSSASARKARLSLYGRVGENEVASHLYLSGNSRPVSPLPSLALACTVAVGLKQTVAPDTLYFGRVEQGYLSQMKAQLEALQPRLEAALPMLKGIDLADELSQWGQKWAAGFLHDIPSLLGSVIAGVTFLVIVPFVVFFLLSEGRAIKRALIEMVPNRYFEMVLNLIYRIDQQLGGYIRGLVIDVSIVALLSIVGLRIVGLQDYLVVGTIAGLSNVIPYLGPIIGMVVGAAAALLQYSSLGAAVPVVAVFLIVHLLDNVFVAPLVVARSVDLHPLVVIFVVLVGNHLFGTVGMLLAVPATAVLKVSVQTVAEGLRSYSVR